MLNPIVTNRRRFLGLAAASTAGADVLSACGGTTPSGPSTAGGGAGAAEMWALNGEPDQPIQTKSVEAFNKLGKGTVNVTFFQADAYKTKIRTAIGANEAPTLIYGWGGGVLKSYVEAGHVDDLTPWLAENPNVKDRYFPGVWGAATFDDKIYAMPCNSTQPIVFFYNKRLFDEAGAEPPVTWEDTFALVEKFNSMGIAPFSLAGQAKWTSMMWMEYVLDRVGGPGVFENIFANGADAWADPAVLTACERIQELVKADGFVKGFSSISTDANADGALLSTGKAAMLVQGSWAYGGLQAIDPDFATNGLGFAAFPTVTGGVGDPKNVVGNPANYWSLSASASDEQKEVAKAYLAEGLLTDENVSDYLAAGGVPVSQSVADKLTEQDVYQKYIFDLVSQAPSFQQSWDQALSPVQSDALLTNIEQLFLLQVTPEQFASNMNATIGK